MKLTNFNNRLECFIKKHKINEVLEQCDFNNEVGVYLASGSMFSELGQIGLELLADLCEQINLKYYLPQHADFNDKTTDDFVITNKMIADGDTKELERLNFVLAHITDPIDSGVSAELGMYKKMTEYEPGRYFGVVGWTDDIRLATKPSLDQPSFHNQTLYLNQFTIGLVENSLGCYECLGDCFLKMHKEYENIKEYRLYA